MADAAHSSFVEFVQDQLAGLPRGVTVRAMFGGHGLYSGGAFFGIAYQGRLYFKTDGSTVARYEAAGAAAFHPPKGPTVRSYYEVPADVLDDRDELVAWAEEAVEVAEAAR